MTESKPSLAEQDPEDVEEIPDDDVAYDAVQSVLEEMSSVYHEDNKTLTVQLTESASAALNQETVRVQANLPEEMDPPVTGPNILRLLDDLLAHEVAHVNWSELDSKQAFADCYPGWGKVPGMVANILEDEYVDAKRQKKWFGLRDKMAYYVWLHMNTESRAPPVDEVEASEGRTSALLTGLFQTALAGYVKGIDDASDDIAQFCNQAEPLIKRVRGEDDPEVRFKLFHAVMQLLIRYAPEPDEVDEDEMEDRMRESEGGGERSIPDSPMAHEPKVDMSESLEKKLEELLSDLIDSGEFPEPDTGGSDGAVSEPDSGAGGKDESESEPDADSGEQSSADGTEMLESESSDGAADTDSSSDGDSLGDYLSEYDPSELKVVN